jgi:hypothetical protein
VCAPRDSLATVIEHEWVHLTAEQLSADPALVRAIERFQAPPGRAGDAAATWLRERALKETSHVATYMLLVEGEIAGFYSLGMSEVELRSQHRKGISASHPRQGAVLVLWLARAVNASVDAASIFRHAVGIAQIGSRRVGAAVIAVDPFDAATEDYWRQHFGFRTSLTKRRDADGEQRSRLWLPLFPEI